MYGKVPEALWTSIRIIAEVISGGDSRTCWEAAVYSAYTPSQSLCSDQRGEKSKLPILKLAFQWWFIRFATELSALQVTLVDSMFVF